MLEQPRTIEPENRRREREIAIEEENDFDERELGRPHQTAFFLESEAIFKQLEQYYESVQLNCSSRIYVRLTKSVSVATVNEVVS